MPSARDVARSTGGLAFVLAALAVPGAIAAVAAADALGPEQAERLFRLAARAAWLALAVAVVALGFRIRARHGAMLPIAAAVLLSGALVLVAAVLPATRAGAPIHDASTDLVDPPRFRAIAARGPGDVPTGGRSELEVLPPELRWIALHERAYPDLRPVELPFAPADVIRRAAALARARGWQIVASDAAAGRLEATDTVAPFGRVEDVVVRVQPQRGGSRVDMRSVSRTGTGDGGSNARRIAAFLSDLAGPAAP